MTRAGAINTLIFGGECAFTAAFAMALAMVCLAATTPSRNLVGAPTLAGGSAPAALQADLTVLTSFDPFHRGAAPVVEEVATQDAPETSLNLTLSFVRVTTDPEDSVAAIVGPGGGVQRYQMGDTVISGVQLRSILVDRVLLERVDGTVEALTLDDGTSLIRSQKRAPAPDTPPDAAGSPPAGGALAASDAQTPAAPSGDGDAAAAEAAPVSSPASAARIDVAALDARALAESVRAEAVTLTDGRPGLRVEAQGDGQALIEAGLETGDVVLEIQGRRVRDQFDLLNAMASLEEEASLSFLVHRGGQDVPITIEFTSSDAGGAR